MAHSAVKLISQFESLKVIPKEVQYIISFSRFSLYCMFFVNALTPKHSFVLARMLDFISPRGDLLHPQNAIMLNKAIF